jgi:hypothetical protein
MPPKKLSNHAARRALVRKHDKLARDLDRLARLEPGGAPERPLEVVSPALVEVTVRGTPCPICGGELRLDEHVAETIGGARLRVARARCAMCGAPRALYFKVTTALPS